MTGDCHVRFSERPGAKLPRATHLTRTLGSARGAPGNGRPYRDLITSSRMPFALGMVRKLA
jgi:hypothetical protein